MAGTQPRFHFVWLEPSDPLGDNNISSMPSRYMENIRAWERRYSESRVVVWTGAMCALAVRRAESLSHIDGLWLQYLSFARRGCWAQCVDIARVAIVYHDGGMYLDTDMALGPVRMPDRILLDPVTAFLAVDDDGVTQNNIIAAPALHRLLHWALKAFVLHSPFEWEVVDSTGPLMWTSLLRCLPTLGVMTSIELLPPERFYPTHWFPLLTPPTRTAALCYGIHTWDRTWVSSARGPDPLFEAEVIEVVTSTDDHKRQEKQRSQQTHRRHFHRTRRSRSGAEGEAASTVSTSDGTSYRTGADASDSGNGSPCDTDNTVSSSQGSSGASEGYSPIPLHACSHDPGTDGDTTTERILYPSAIIQVVDSSVSSEQNRGPTEIRPNGTLVFEDKAVFLGYAAAYRTIGVAQALDGSSGGYDAFKSSTPAAAPVAPALHSGHHVMGLTSSGTPPRPARLAPLATSHEDCPVCRSAGVVSGSVAQRSPPTPKIDSNSDSEAEASDSELEASSPSPVRIPPIVPDDPPEHERGVVHEDSAPAQLESAFGILCSSVSPTDPAYAVDAVHDDDSVQNGAVALDDTLTIGSVITEDDGGELTSTVSPIRLPDVDVALPGDNREQGDGGLHWHECVAIPEAVSLAVASAVLQPTTVASSSDVELALLSSVESVASVGVAIPPNVAVSLEADPVRVPISVASKPHPVRSRRAATIAAHQSALLERVDALTERMMHRLSTNLRGLDRISASFSRLPQDL